MGYSMFNNMERLTLALVVIIELSTVIITSALSITDSIQNDEKSSVLPERQDQGKNLVCYYSMPKGVQPLPIPEDLNATLCTHVIYTGVGTKNLTPGPFSAAQESFINMSIPAMKKINPKVKIMLCHGGGFDEVLVSEYARSSFVNNSAKLLRKYGFDGMDLDWEFPAWQGRPWAQRKNFTLVLEIFSKVFLQEASNTGRPKLLISAAVSGFVEVMFVSYDIPLVSKYLDIINLMGYDYHNYFLPLSFTGYNSPLYYEEYDILWFATRNLNWSVNAWIREGAPREKILAGLPVYLHAYKLVFEEIHGLGAPSDGRGNFDQGSYPLVCEAFEKYNATRVWDDNCKVPYAYYGDQWVSYDDEESLTIKTKWAITNNLGGVMVFIMNADDYAGQCKGGKKFPLYSAIHNAMFGSG